MDIKRMLGFKKKQSSDEAEEPIVGKPIIKEGAIAEEPVKKVVKPSRMRIDKQALKNLHLVVVAYSHVERDFFPTKEAYEAEVEVEDRAEEVVQVIKKMGIPVKSLPGNQYFLTNLLVDKPDIVINLVDT